ncbi:hypothetical protein HOL21_01125 [Candidatus Woesearchaeota archaeon]|jgi:hypothetical protein|nr:hypothetical protein [Candidatus Woesearchaeota archaeon]MBT5396796.1 hypothetical protein [Candidatus Woesearchaeota archaeon]MBT6367684.1 hypothetical protein [Candidatus Woesearchaeota archaeon]MBT7762915.1 hypothetical protein [Candidatus Woesearchaeota archaeon]
MPPEKKPLEKLVEGSDRLIISCNPRQRPVVPVYIGAPQILVVGTSENEDEKARSFAPSKAVAYVLSQVPACSGFGRDDSNKENVVFWYYAVHYCSSFTEIPNDE